MEAMNVLESLFRWLHVVFGILWVGFLYFLNFVNAAVEAALDGETKRKLIPELRPRVLFWFRMAAAMTWVTGVLLLMLVYYHGGAAFDGLVSWGIGPVLMILLVFASPFAYDALVRGVMKELPVAFGAGLALSFLLMLAFQYIGGFGVRGYAIHLGATFGTIMAFNVWFRIWPAQRQIIAAIRDGEAPDPGLVALAGLRSRHNTYLSVPLVFLMLSQHSVVWANSPLLLTVVILLGWGLVYRLYGSAAAVKGM